MLPFPSYYGFESCSSRGGFLNGLGTMERIDGGGGSTFSLRSMAEEKAIAACKSHSEAERRRRERINGHLATLRTLLPNKTKTDKASLLAEVVQHVKELKRLATDLADQDGDGCSRSREWPFPGESDELTLSYCDAESSSLQSSSLIRASLSCDDRPDLMSDLTQALRSVRVRIVKAEIATVGGRTKSVLVIQGRGEGSGDDELGTLRRTLRGVINKPAVSASGQVSSASKRLRLSHQLSSVISHNQ